MLVLIRVNIINLYLIEFQNVYRNDKYLKLRYVVRKAQIHILNKSKELISRCRKYWNVLIGNVDSETWWTFMGIQFKIVHYAEEVPL